MAVKLLLSLTSYELDIQFVLDLVEKVTDFLLDASLLNS